MIGFIGAGNMGGAIIDGILNSENNFEVSICDLNEDTLNKYKSKVKIVSKDPIDVINNSNYIFLAIKPYQYKDFLEKHQEILKDKIIISIAAGISCEFMSKYTKRFVLTMPNTPLMVKDGITCILRNNDLNENELLFISEIYSKIGKVYFIDKEEDIEVFITLSGSSPAYFGVFLEAMVEFGVSKGFDKSLAKEIVCLAMRGSSEWYFQSDDSLREQLLKVCSPNGTTIQAVNNFDNSDFNDVIKVSMQKCYDRAIEIKKENDSNE